MPGHEFGKRAEDNNSSVLSQVTRKYPVASLMIATAGSFVGSMITVMTLMTEPIKHDVTRIDGALEINRGHVHDINKRIGSGPRAAPDVAKLFERTDNLRRSLNNIEHRVGNIQKMLSEQNGIIRELQRSYDKLYKFNSRLTNGGSSYE